MKHRRKQTDRRAPRPEDLHLAIGQMLDKAAWAASIAVDAADDRCWLQSHPNAEFRKRRISVREMKATGYPADTVVTVRRGPRGSQIREFGPPESPMPLARSTFSQN